MRLRLRRVCLRLRLRRRGAVTDRAARPSAEQLQRQSDRLRPLRTRLLRGVQVARRRRIVDLGAGYGAVTGELVRRGGGSVVAVDAADDFLDLDGAPFAGAERVRARSDALPLPSASVDLVVCQYALLWMPLPATLDEIVRVLAPGGALVAIEPDLGGTLEAPDRGLGTVWRDALRRAGADPAVGRALPSALDARGMRVRVELIPEVAPPGAEALALLDGLPLTDDERARVEPARAALDGSWSSFLWTPVLGVTATKR